MSLPRRAGRGRLFKAQLNWLASPEGWRRGDAVRAFLKDRLANGESLSEVIDEIAPATISQHLYTVELPDPGLIIRTSGEIRLSGFLLWQSAQANSISPISTGQPSARLISCGPCDRISSEGEDSGFSFCRASTICRSSSYRRVWEADRLTE
jgi:hypothetical protein